MPHSIGKYFKKYLLFVLLLIGICIYSYCTKTKPMNELKILVAPDNKPFCYIDTKSGNVSGFETDLITEVTKRIGKKPHIICGEFASLIPSLHSNIGQIAIAAIAVTDKRCEKVAFSTCYYKTYTVLISKTLYSKVMNETINGKRIAVQISTSTLEDLNSALQQGNYVAIIQKFDTIPTMIAALDSGVVDFIAIDIATARQLVTKDFTKHTEHENTQFDSKYFIVQLNDNYDADNSPQLDNNVIQTNYNETAIPTPSSQVGYAIAASKNIKGQQLIKEINQALEEMEKDGTIQKLQKKWKV
jgi:polar amino acid transport system substrate-binding protein